MPKKVPTYRPPAASIPVHHAPRENTAWRAFLNSRPWRRLSKWYLTRNPLCVRCQARGRFVASAHVHHIKGQDMEYAFDPETFEALCASCHSQETRAEMSRTQADASNRDKET
jgi:5-methylcytosine-specific restriction enzyme A